MTIKTIAASARPHRAGGHSRHHPSARAWTAAALSMLLLPTLAQPAGPTAPLNDTGQTQCYDGSALVACTAANTGDSAAYPGQDARFGRDAAQRTGQLNKVGGGAAGFDFTALDASGSVIPPSLGNHQCVYDNVTGLLWSTETRLISWDAAMADHPSDGSGNYTRCGCNTGWRLPTRRELLSIVHYGITDSSRPTVDQDYFPDTLMAVYWTADPYKPDPAYVWSVGFNNGLSNALIKDNSFPVRLVRSGQ